MNVDDALAKIGSLQHDADQAAQARADLEAQLDERFSELAQMAYILRQQERRGDRLKDQVEWLGQVHHALRDCPRWWALLPRGWGIRRQYERLRRQGLFDADGYLARYTDVAQAGKDPLDHYIRDGQREGRVRG